MVEKTKKNVCEGALTLKTIKPIKLGSTKTSAKEKLTSAEMGKLWATYSGNSMSKCIISYYLQHVDDKDIKVLLENALNLCEDFMRASKEILDKEGFPLPIGFSKEDVNLGAPRLFEDEFYVHYLKYAAKAGMSIYNVAIPLVYRDDVNEFFTYSLKATIDFMNQIKEVLMNKGFIFKPPLIPYLKKLNLRIRIF